MLSLRFYNRIERKLIYKKIGQSFYIFVFALIFFSCEQDLNIEIKTNDKRLLVDGEFTTDSVIHTIRLSCSGSLITGQPQTVVTRATIYVTDNTEIFYYIEMKDTPGVYQTSGKCCGKGGRTYSLTITNIDIDQDGKMDLYTANSLMPVPLKIDSLVSSRGLNGDGNMAVNNYAYYKLYYNEPDYAYPFTLLNNQKTYGIIADRNNNINYGTIIDRLGTGEFTRFENNWKLPKVLNPESVVNYRSYNSINSTVLNGDTISFIIFNFTTAQFEFFKEFDKNTSSGNPFIDNIYDQLKIPSNLPTNIEPSDKAAGYFFIYSISKISNVFNQ
jgi:hypothetical protein